MKFERSDTKNYRLDIWTALSSSVPALNINTLPNFFLTDDSPSSCHSTWLPFVFYSNERRRNGSGKMWSIQARHELSRNNVVKKYPTTRNNCARRKILSNRSAFARSSSTDSWVCIHGCADEQQVLTLYRPACTLYRSTSTLVQRVFTSEAGWRTEPPVCRPNAGKSSTVSREATGKYTST